jgi:carboxyl-terminal processing protease
MMAKLNNFVRFRYAFLVTLVFLLGLSIGLVGSRKVGAVTDGIYENLKVFTDVLSIIQKDYVDAEKTDSEDLVYGAVGGMLETLDPHSSFMPPDVFKEAQFDTKGKFEGLGIQIEMREDILTVVSPIEGTPAWDAGIKPEDQILEIDGEPTKTMTLMETVRRLRGPKGTEVTITIMREGFDKAEDFTITRGIIPIRSVRSETLEKDYAYVRINQFSERTNSEFEESLKKLEKSGKEPPKGLILDLRNNPGGLLDQAVKVADYFVNSGVIVSIRGRLPSNRSQYKASSTEPARDYPVVVLVNNGSASGSEIVAGALQDHRKGVIVGTQTFGKATVQTLYPLRDGSGLRLTTGRYFTPSGRDIQAGGIKPDVFLPAFKGGEKESKEEEKSAGHFLEKDLEGHLESTTGPEEPEEEQYQNPELDRFINGIKADIAEKESDGQKFVALQILKNWEAFQNLLHDGEQKS